MNTIIEEHHKCDTAVSEKFLPLKVEKTVTPQIEEKKQKLSARNKIICFMQNAKMVGSSVHVETISSLISLSGFGRECDCNPFLAALH